MVSRLRRGKAARRVSDPASTVNYMPLSTMKLTIYHRRVFDRGRFEFPLRGEEPTTLVEIRPKLRRENKEREARLLHAMEWAKRGSFSPATDRSILRQRSGSQESRKNAIKKINAEEWSWNDQSPGRERTIDVSWLASENEPTSKNQWRQPDGKSRPVRLWHWRSLCSIDRLFPVKRP